MWENFPHTPRTRSACDRSEHFDERPSDNSGLYELACNGNPAYRFAMAAPIGFIASNFGLPSPKISSSGLAI